MSVRLTPTRADARQDRVRNKGKALKSGASRGVKSLALLKAIRSWLFLASGVSYRLGSSGLNTVER